MYGIGELETGEYGRNAGMAGVSIGIRSHDMLNNSNPASLTGIDSMTFLYDFSALVQWSTFNFDNQTANTTIASFKKIAMGFCISHRWAIGFGLAPYSTVGYTINSTQPVEGTYGLTVPVNYNGDGGLNKLFMSNAYMITPKISIGINTSALFGSINNNIVINGWNIETTSNTNKFYFDFGLQYIDTFAKNISYVFGLVYGYNASITMNTNLAIYDQNNSTLENESIGTENQYLPMFYGAGISVSLNNKYTFAADYRYQNSSKIVSNAPGVYLADMHNIKLGLEYKNIRPYYENYFQRISYQTGIAIGNSYLKINGYNPLSYGVCAGLSMPIRNIAMLNFSFELR